MNLPSAFEEKMKNILGNEFEEYIACYEEPRYYGLRVNTNKITTDGFSAIAERAFKREQQISHTPFSRNKNIAFENNAVKEENKTFKNAIDKVLQNNVSKNESVQEIQVEDQYGDNADDIILKKALTDREQLVFEYFVNKMWSKFRNIFKDSIITL